MPSNVIAIFPKGVKFLYCYFYAIFYHAMPNHLMILGSDTITFAGRITKYPASYVYSSLPVSINLSFNKNTSGTLITRISVHPRFTSLIAIPSMIRICTAAL